MGVWVEAGKGVYVGIGVGTAVLVGEGGSDRQPARRASDRRPAMESIGEAAFLRPDWRFIRALIPQV
jgi:hypothetical protein